MRLRSMILGSDSLAARTAADGREPATLRTRAFDREGLAGRVAPFALAGAVAVVVAVDVPDLTWLAVGAVLTAATILLALFVPWRRLPRWSDAIPPLVYLAAVAALRHAGGGAASGYAPLFLVPILWLAMYGTRAQLLLALVGLGLALVVPIVLVGAPHYPFSDWRRLVILVTISATLGIMVQRLVREVRAQTERAVARGSALAEQRDATEAILDAASDAVVSFDRSGTVLSANSAADALFGRTDLIGKDVFDTLVPEHEIERLRGGFGRLLLTDTPSQREARFVAELRHADGRLIPVEIAVARTKGPTGVWIHAFVRDETVRSAAEQGAQDHLRDLERLLAVARELGGPEVDARTAICAAARELSDADFVLFFAPLSEAGPLIVTGSSGDSTVSSDVELDREHSVAGQVLRTTRPSFSGDLAADPRLDPGAVRQIGAGAAYWQPVVSDGLGVGVLVAYWRRPFAALPERTAALLGLFATQASTVIERADLLARLEGLARTDALTGVANRRALDETLPVALAGARRTGQPLSIAMLDLDHFKRYNDEHGHQAGDDLLQRIAAVWKQAVRPGDMLARYGGEEFLATLPSCDPHGAVVVADRLRAVVPGSQTASVGTATWDGVETLEALIARADAALYQAKAAGRDRTVASSGPADGQPGPVA